MISLKNEIATIEEELSIIDNQIAAMKVDSDREANVVYYEERLTSVNLEDVGEVRAMLHELIDKITLEEKNIHIEYRYSFL